MYIDRRDDIVQSFDHTQEHKDHSSSPMAQLCEMKVVAVSFRYCE
jgi:hypothetical protein